MLPDLSVTFLGDSKTSDNFFSFQSQLITILKNFTNTVYEPTQLATSGWRASELNSATASWLSGVSNLDRVMINVGINDIIQATSQATYESNLGQILDKIHAAFPSAKVYVERVWGRNRDAACNTMDDVWIPNALSTRASFAFVGGDERVYLKGSDDGASETTDGIHRTALGETLTAYALRAALGY